MCQSKCWFTCSGFSTCSVLSQWHEFLWTVTLSIAIVGHQFDFIHRAGIYRKSGNGQYCTHCKSIKDAHAFASHIHNLTHIHWAGFVDFAVTVELLISWVMGIEVWCKTYWLLWSFLHFGNFLCMWCKICFYQYLHSSLSPRIFKHLSRNNTTKYSWRSVCSLALFGWAEWRNISAVTVRT